MPDASPLTFCWFQGKFTGFPVPPGAADTFAYVAYVVGDDGVVVPIVATNDGQAASKGPMAAS